MIPKAIVVLALAWLVVGCAAKHRFDLSVQNATGEPITVWLTKEGTPDEAHWRSRCTRGRS